MAQLRQGAPGVRIRLRDVSEVTLITSPNIVGGIVGFSTRGELNKIIKLNSTSDMDVNLGSGYNNPRYNQGLYAARAVLTAGGFVEYVRPYGEVVIQDDTDPAYAYNQQLKSDTYLINYNFATGVSQSFDNDFWTSTRYVQDAYANYGTRYINTISDTIVQNTNIDFSLNADSLPDGQGGFDKTSLFSIINTDPTAANRAGNKYDIAEIKTTGTVPETRNITSIKGASAFIPYHIDVATSAPHGLNTGNSVSITGTTNYNTPTPVTVTVTSNTTFYFESDLISSQVLESAGTVGYSVTTIKVTTKNNNAVSVGNTVVIGGTVNYNNPNAVVVTTGPSLKEFTYTLHMAVSYPSEIVGAVFLNLDTIASGSDYVAIKTAARGRATKYFDGVLIGAIPSDGDLFTFLEPDGTVGKFEFDSSPIGVKDGDTRVPVQTNSVVSSGVVASVTIQGQGGPLPQDIVITTTTPHGLQTGDVISITGSTSYNIASVAITLVDPLNVKFSSSTLTAVTSESGTMATLSLPAGALVLQYVTNLQVNDLVEFDFTGGGITTGLQYVVSQISGTNVYLYNVTTWTALNITQARLIGNLKNLTGTLRNVQNAVKNTGYIYTPTRAYFNAKTGIQTDGSIKVSDASKFNVNDITMVFNNFSYNNGVYNVSVNGLDSGSNGTAYVVTSINLSANTITLAQANLSPTGSVISTSPIVPVNGSVDVNVWIVNITRTKGGTNWVSDEVIFETGVYKPELLVSGFLGLKVPLSIQDKDPLSLFNFTSSPSLENMYTSVMETSRTNDGILLSTDVGKEFLDLGLATDTYVDINFNGTQTKVYELNDAGIIAARIYLFVSYFFSGNLFQFSGTVIPFAANSINLSIAETANSVAVGWKYITNDNSSLQSAVENTAFDLSQSTNNGIIQADWVTLSFNPNDPAVLNNAIWSYDPSKNNTTLTYGGAWQLFLDKDFAGSDMLISAGTAINNLFVKGREELNYDVMNIMLDVCEKRKDLFAIFDGVNEPNINKALQKMVGIGGNGDLARWGGIYDGRSLFFDSAYTKLVVEAVQTIPLANIITANRTGNTWWLPPAGYDYGRMPAQWARTQLYTRTYKYADDPNSDVARLYDANINPIRVNDQGQFVYGQKTMLKRSTALNRMNVIMLIAGIHKRFENYLDSKVFQLNTSQLRANIQADLQAQLNNIKSATPAGISAGLVICDDTNNPPIIIDTNQLIVDVVIQPTRSTEFITLRTTVQRTGADLNVSTSTIIGG